MEAKLFCLVIEFDSVENESVRIEFPSYSDTVSCFVRRILRYYDSKPVRSFFVAPVDVPHLGSSILDPSNIDLFNYLIQ